MDRVSENNNNEYFLETRNVTKMFGQFTELMSANTDVSIAFFGDMLRQDLFSVYLVDKREGLIRIDGCRFAPAKSQDHRPVTGVSLAGESKRTMQATLDPSDRIK